MKFRHFGIRCGRFPLQAAPEAPRYASGFAAAVTSCPALMMARKSAGLEAGAADQRAVDVGAGEQFGGVVRLDAPPILDDNPGGCRFTETRRASQRRMNAWTAWACSGVAVRPVPIAQTGS